MPRGVALRLDRRNRLPYLATSTDEGATWSEPRLVSPPGVTETALPNLAINDAGRVAMVYLGSTNAPGGDAPPVAGPEYDDVTWDGWMTWTDDAGAADPTFTSVAINDPADPLVRGVCGTVRCQQQFDFGDVVVADDGTVRVAGGRLPERHDRCPAMGLGVIGSVVLGAPAPPPTSPPPPRRRRRPTGRRTHRHAAADRTGPRRDRRCRRPVAVWPSVRCWRRPWSRSTAEPPRARRCDRPTMERGDRNPAEG